MLTLALTLLRRTCAVLAVLLALPAAQALAQGSVTINGKAVAGPAPLVYSLVGAYPIISGQVSQTGVSFYVTNGVTGQFLLNLAQNQSYLVVANVVPNGSHTDPVVGNESLSGTLRAVITTGTGPVMDLTISPFSEAMTQVIMGETAAQQPQLITPALIATAQAKAATYLMSVDPLTTTALNASSTSDMATATPAQKLFALALAGLSQARTNTNRTLTSLIQQNAALIQAGGSLLDAGGGFSADPENEDPLGTLAAMQRGVSGFVASAQNKSGVTSLYNLARTVLGGAPQGGTVGAPWTAACETSVTADLATRFQLPQTGLDKSLWKTPAAYGNLSWGPSPLVYPTVSIPTGCDPTTWQQKRILAAASLIVQQQFNYCHHYIPAWDSKGLLFGGQASYCYSGTNSSAGAGASAVSANQATQMGVDCSNFSAFLYNFAFGGIRFTGDVQSQGGTMAGAAAANNYGTAWAPGTAFARPSNMTALITPGSAVYQQYPFQPGDLLFIGPTEASALQGKISHVVIWTGLRAPDGRYLTVESYGVVNDTPSGKVSAQSPIPNSFLTNSAAATGYSSAYINNSGPNIRYFEGTFRATNLVHYRRVIGS
ncbi:MAG: hypothetical protein J0H82_16905 [Alphaproteobacteria bacterium]|jgi:hypothetical protein|nr:hypothetical protein [Alphaproteobacteria bacterium]